MYSSEKSGMLILYSQYQSVSKGSAHMDFQNNQNNQTQGPFPNPPHNGMPGGYPNPMPGTMPVSVQAKPQLDNGLSNAAMILGIISAVSFCMLLLFPFLPFAFGSISIVLALLSRGSRKKLPPHAKAGLITSVFSLCAAFLLIFAFLYFIIVSGEFMEEFNRTYEEYYGESYEDFYEFYY